MADDTNVGETDDSSLNNEDEEGVPWLEQDVMDDDEALLVTVNDEDTDDEDDNVEVPETQFEYDEWVNDEADDDDEMDGDDIVDVDAENLVTVNELADQIQKKVQMKIEPMNKVAATTDCYKNEITQLQQNNVVAYRKLKRDRGARSKLVPKEETIRTVSGNGGEGNCATKEA